MHPTPESVVRTLIEKGFNEGDLEVVDAITSPELIEHQNFGPSHAPGAEGVRAVVESLRRAFPDFRLTIEDLVADGDTVWLRMVATGTNAGSFMGHAPTGRPIRIDVFDVDPRGGRPHGRALGRAGPARGDAAAGADARRPAPSLPEGSPTRCFDCTGGGHHQGMQVRLEGVPETLLWTLYQRASEARRPDSVLRDPRAVEVLDAIDFPFEQRFGKAGSELGAVAGAARALLRPAGRALSARTTPTARSSPSARGSRRSSGASTTAACTGSPSTCRRRSRCASGSCPRPIASTSLACSALDTRLDRCRQPAPGVLVTAQGLLMYLAPDEVRRVIKTCAARFPGGGARLRRRAALAQRAQPAGQARVAGRLASAALDVVDRRATRSGSCSSARTSASCASCGCRAAAGR